MCWKGFSTLAGGKMNYSQSGVGPGDCSTYSMLVVLSSNFISFNFFPSIIPLQWQWTSCCLFNRPGCSHFGVHLIFFFSWKALCQIATLLTSLPPSSLHSNATFSGDALFKGSRKGLTLPFPYFVFLHRLITI